MENFFVQWFLKELLHQELGLVPGYYKKLVMKIDFK